MNLSRRSALTGMTLLPSLSVLASTPASAASGVRSWKQYVSGGWGQIHLWMAEPANGPGRKPPLLCLHQSPTSGDYYREFQALMATDRVVISPDTPGYGSSTAPPSQPDLKDYGAVFVELISELGYGPGGNGPVDLLGFHTGNFIAIEIVRQAPHLVRKLVMPGIPYFPADEREKIRVSAAEPRPYFSDPNYVADTFRTRVFEREAPPSKERLLELYTEAMRGGTKTHYAVDAVFRYDPDPVLKSIKQPVLLPILNEGLADHTRAAGAIIKNATVIELLDLDTRGAWFGAPERLVEVIRPFLDNN